MITEAGNIERYFYFVLEGVQAIYILNENGEKVVLGFSYSGSPSGGMNFSADIIWKVEQGS